MKILVSAYACTPGRGSEPGIGWGAALQASRRHDVWLLTHPEGREKVEAELDRLKLREKIRVTYQGSMGVRETLFRSRTLRWLYYDAWQGAAYRVARTLHRSVRFDVAHHVTFASWRVPTFLHELDLPVIWGPVGGGHGSPPALLGLLGPMGRLKEQLRDAAQYISARDPRVRRALRRCRLVVPCSTMTRDFLCSMRPDIAEPACETAIALEDVPDAPRPCASPGGPMRIYWSGVHEPRKCLPLLLHALNRCKDINFHLEVAGDGPERIRWQRLTESLGLSDRVAFLGSLQRPEALRRLAESNVFAFSSLREATGTVLLEAMACRRPVVALRWSGAPDLVPPEAGILVDPTSLESALEGFEAALRRLTDPQVQSAMGEAGRRVIEQSHTWAVAGDRYDAMYRRLAEHAS